MPMHESIKLNTPCEMINITSINPLISKCQIKVCYVSDKPNRNGSIITKEVATQMANSLPGSPIVGFYNQDTKDFEEHNRDLKITEDDIYLIDVTRPYGFVDINAKVWFQQFQEGTEVREYLMTEGYLWTGQYPECERVVEEGNNQSMELDEDTLKAHWTNFDNDDFSFFIINEAIISKLCILGQDYEPCFEGAQITKVQFSLGDSFKDELFSMINQIKELLNEGGVAVDNEVITEVVENDPENTQNFAEKLCPECGKPIDECECEPEEEDKKDKYNLNEIPEYMELSEKYNTLQSQYNALESEINSLREFKAAADKKEKEALINSFYMLSEDDKRDVVENIDNYSLDEIEAKLSIICVRNKVSFNLEEEKKEDVVVYSVSQDVEDEAVPAWVKAMRSVAKDM